MKLSTATKGQGIAPILGPTQQVFEWRDREEKFTPAGDCGNPRLVNYAYKFRAYPTKDQVRKIGHHFDVCDYVYNHCLDRRIKLYRETGKSSSLASDSKYLTGFTKDKPGMREVGNISLRQELRRLDAAFKRFFKTKKGFPKHKSKNSPRNSFTTYQSIRLDGNRIFFNKFKEGVKIKMDRAVEGRIVSATISRHSSGRYFVAVCVERHLPLMPKTDKQVGIDVGLKTFAVCSDGTHIDNPKNYVRMQKRLRLLQKSVSRKKKGSRNREKAKKRLATLHWRIACSRSDFTHKTSRKIVNENQLIAIEDLNVKGMMSNHKLAKQVGDAAWSEFRRQLEYKSDWAGREVVAINQWFPSSKKCGNCGEINMELTLGDREWRCGACQTVHDRDLNAAKNILEEALRMKREQGDTISLDEKANTI